MFTRFERHFCARWLFFVLWALVVDAVLSTTAGAVVRVAFMDAICDDNSYRSTVGAVNLTTTLQASLADMSNFEWVERAELAKAVEEFKLGGFGLIDRAEAIRNGRWVKADLGVFMRIATNGVNGRKVTMEVENLQHADLLVSTNLTLAPNADTYFRATSQEVAQIASTLRALLQEVWRLHANSRTQVNVAVLFLTGGGLPDLEARFRDMLPVAATNGPPLHVIRIQHTDAAIDEADLVLTGLAQMDPHAWEKVADQYIWGKYAAWSQEVALNVWDGRSEPRIIRQRVTNASSGDLAARELAAIVAPLLSERNANSADEGSRRRISDSLVGHALELARGSPLGWMTAGPEWLEVVQVLETACFFDPGNQVARELWTRVRWNEWTGQASQNAFFFARRRSDAWHRYVEQFGFSSVCPPPILSWWKTNSVASEYVLSAWRPFEMFQYSQYNQAEWGVPRDAGGREIMPWIRRFGDDLFTRLPDSPDDAAVQANSLGFLYGALAMDVNQFVFQNAQQRQRIIEKLWPHILEGAREHGVRPDDAYLRRLKIHFKELGRPGGEAALVSQLEQAAAEFAEKVRTQPAKLPRASELDQAGKLKSNP